MDTIDFTSTTQMATILMRRHRDLSTVRAMVKNEFGRAPSIDLLAVMRERDERRRNHRSRNHGHYLREAYSINASNDAHEAAMERGSAALLKAIREAV